MPRYDYTCSQCGHVEEKWNKYEHRIVTYPCSRCSEGVMEYMFPYGAIHGYQPFKPVYVETLGCDVSSRGELRHILKDQGLQEAGDKVGGARNWDPKANNIMPQEPRGISYLELQKRRADAQSEVKQPVIKGED